MRENQISKVGCPEHLSLRLGTVSHGTYVSFLTKWLVVSIIPTFHELHFSPSRGQTSPLHDTVEPMRLSTITTTRVEGANVKFAYSNPGNSDENIPYDGAVPRIPSREGLNSKVSVATGFFDPAL